MQSLQGPSDILSRMATGDSDAKQEVLRLSYGSMRQMARAILRTQGDNSLSSLDIVHETIVLRMSRAIPPANDWQHFRSIVARLLRETVLDRGRRRATRRKHSESVTPDAPCTLAAEVRTDLSRAMERLSQIEPRAARIVMCRDVEGMTWEEIAALFGKSSRHVRGDYSFARAWLRERLSS